MGAAKKVFWNPETLSFQDLEEPLPVTLRPDAVAEAGNYTDAAGETPRKLDHMSAAIFGGDGRLSVLGDVLEERVRELSHRSTRRLHRDANRGGGLSPAHRFARGRDCSRRLGQRRVAPLPAPIPGPAGPPEKVPPDTIRLVRLSELQVKRPRQVGRVLVERGIMAATTAGRLLERAAGSEP